jgi:hypothetical protein
MTTQKNKYLLISGTYEVLEWQVDKIKKKMKKIKKTQIA